VQTGITLKALRSMGMTFFMILWLITGIAFWVTLIIWGINRAKKRESKITGKVPLILLAISVVSLIFGAVLAPSDNSDTTADVSSSTSKKSVSMTASEKESSKKAASESASKASSKAAAKASSESASSKAASESEAKESSERAASASVAHDPATYQTGITYDQVARTPDEYEDKKVQFTGRVLQVMEDKSGTQIRLGVDGSYDNIILVSIDKSNLNGSRILEDDLVTVSGISSNTITYESTLGGNITIPSMIGLIVDNQGPASDDYGY